MAAVFDSLLLGGTRALCAEDWSQTSVFAQALSELDFHSPVFLSQQHIGEKNASTVQKQV